MSASGEKAILEKYRALPPQRLAEVAAFLDFLQAAEARAQTADRLSRIFRKRDDLDQPVLGTQEALILAQIKIAKS